MWFLLALTFAFISSFALIIAKRIMREADEYSYLWLNILFSLPVLIAIILLFYEIPVFDTSFLFLIFFTVLINALAATLAYRAIKISDLSLVNPISSFNPVFTALIAYLFMGEKLDVKSILGILIIILGAYLLQISKLKEGIFRPFKALVNHKGVQMSFVAYFLWSVTPILQKTAIFHTTPRVPVFVSFIGLVGSLIVYTPLVARFSKHPIKIAKKYLWLFLISGFISGIGQAVAFTAFSLGSLGLVTAIFKLSMLFTVIFGWLFFKERNIRDRLVGSLVMLVGVVLLVV
jgi:drug/metabolite transporter (DMT)-like permease